MRCIVRLSTWQKCPFCLHDSDKYTSYSKLNQIKWYLSLKHFHLRLLPRCNMYFATAYVNLWFNKQVYLIWLFTGLSNINCRKHSAFKCNNAVSQKCNNDIRQNIWMNQAWTKPMHISVWIRHHSHNILIYPEAWLFSFSLFCFCQMFD